jgi:hypothetical protein
MVLLAACCKPESRTVCGELIGRVNATATTGVVYAIIRTDDVPPVDAYIHITLDQYNGWENGQRYCGVPFQTIP